MRCVLDKATPSATVDTPDLILFFSNAVCLVGLTLRYSLSLGWDLSIIPDI